ncbi:proton-conducting transporter transmembrane domain-containing protein [Sphingomonas sp. GlSt437]
MTPLFVFAGPALLGIASIVAALGRGQRPRLSLAVCEAAAMLALLIAIGAAIMLGGHGASTAALIGDRSGLGLAVRLDIVSAAMLLLVSFIGWVVTRYARTYLDGEARQGPFMARLAATLACVLLLVSAGTLTQLVLAWIGTSAALHGLLLFYPDRAGARRAARKKFLFARLGDGALIAAALLLVAAYGTGDIAAIAAAARAASATGATPGTAIAAAWLIAIAALLKSAQFPTHGWLTEMMETPTPVSALLHAGVINAGGFLLIRLADILPAAPAAMAMLVMIGGFTALFGSLVMVTQPAAKTSLAWSTVAQMGFMTMQCGLGLFGLALLHVVAHSHYKAHTFLAAGDAVERIAAARRPGPVAVPDMRAIGLSFLSAMIIYLAVGLAFGLWHKPPQAIVLGAVLIFGVAYLIAQGLSAAAPRALMERTTIAAILTATAYFALHGATAWVTAGTLPPTPAAGPLEWVLMAAVVLSFGGIALAQAMLPLWGDHPAAQGLRVHLANGLYVNTLVDRAIGGWRIERV